MRVLDHLLRTAAQDPAAERDLLRRMAAPQRHYHGLAHLGLLWFRHCRFSAGTAFACPDANRLIACAIMFHDAVYDPTREDSEARSAALWRSTTPSGFSASQVEWVAATIEATADHLAVTDADTEPARLRLWLLDLDLTPLGDTPTVFARNTHALRREFAHLSDAAWRSRQLAFLRRVQAAERIYRSAPLAAAFEAQARRNITRVLRDAR